MNTIVGLEKILDKVKSEYLVVKGDTNTALAESFSASISIRRKFEEHKKIKIVHIEAGLRSFDKKIPKETNRKITDQLSSFLFVTKNLI